MKLKSILKTLKLHESTISMILGAIVIIFVGVIFINFLSNRKGQTIPPIEFGDQTTLPTTHVVGTGEDLWSISEKYYGTGYNWIDIAKENNISNPNQIKAGQTLNIPNVEPRIAKGEELPSPTIIAEATPAEKPTPLRVGKNVHKVVKGETLWKIAENYFGSGYNWIDIAKENNISMPYVIEPNQEIIIPEAEVRTLTSKSTESKAEPINGTSYTVQKGDNLWQIAVRAFGDGYQWIKIANDNKLTNPGIIHPGNVLNIPR